jgi:nucleoside-diphosphate-sugar epimerase
MSKEKVLITGGSGYIGSVLTGHLLEEGHDVTCLDNLIYGQKSLFNYADNPNFNFVYGDARDRNVMKELVPKSDVIIPLAAIVGMPACNLKPMDAENTNKEAIFMLNELRDYQKVIFPNTNSGYGTKTGEVFCTEETPLEPISSYGKMKCEAEEHLLNSDKNAITLRLATVFGTSPRMRTDLMVNDFVLKAIRDKTLVLYEKNFKRNYIHIKDVARGFKHCIDNYDDMKNEPYNLGLEDANLSKLELAEKIKSYLPQFEIICKEIGKDPDKRDYIVSNQKILKTGFKPKFSLDDGIKELIKGYNILLRNDPYMNL